MHTLSLDSPLSYFEELAERLPNGQSAILPNLGHLLVMEDPKRTGTPGCARSGSAEKALIDPRHLGGALGNEQRA